MAFKTWQATLKPGAMIFLFKNLRKKWNSKLASLSDFMTRWRTESLWTTPKMSDATSMIGYKTQNLNLTEMFDEK